MRLPEGLFSRSCPPTFAILVAFLLLVVMALISAGGAGLVNPAHAQDPAPVPRLVSGPTIVSEPGVDSDGDGRNDTYGPSDIIEFRVGFSEQVCGWGMLSLTFQTGTGPSTVKNAEYGGCGPDAVFFEYQVGPGDTDLDGVSVAANSISLRTYDEVVPDAAHDAVPSNPDHKVNGSLPDTTPPSIGGGAPRISNSPSSGDTYTRGEDIQVEAGFTDPVVVNTSGGLPTIELEIGGETRRAQYDASESDGPRLVFAYTVQAEDRDDDGEVWVVADSLVVPSGSSIKDAAGNLANLSWKVSSGGLFKVEAGFTDPVVVNTSEGLPTIEVEIEGETHRAQYDDASESGDTRLTITTYRDTVQAEDRDDDGVVRVFEEFSLIVPSGSSIKDAVGDAGLSWSVSSGSILMVDGRMTPTATPTPTNRCKDKLLDLNPKRESGDFICALGREIPIGATVLVATIALLILALIARPWQRSQSP